MTLPPFQLLVDAHWRDVARLAHALVGPDDGDDVAQQLQPLIAHSWSLATALSLLAWYVYAPQCVSTLVAVKRETNGWKYPLMMLVQLFGLAYLAAFVTYRIALAFGAG